MHLRTNCGSVHEGGHLRRLGELRRFHKICSARLSRVQTAFAFAGSDALGLTGQFDRPWTPNIRLGIASDQPGLARCNCKSAYVADDTWIGKSLFL